MAQTITTSFFERTAQHGDSLTDLLHPEEPNTINIFTYMSNILPMTIHLFNKINTTILLGYLIDFIRFSTQCTPNTLRLVLSNLNNNNLLSFLTGQPQFFQGSSSAALPCVSLDTIISYLFQSWLRY